MAELLVCASSGALIRLAHRSGPKTRIRCCLILYF